MIILLCQEFWLEWKNKTPFNKIHSTSEDFHPTRPICTKQTELIPNFKDKGK